MASALGPSHITDNSALSQANANALCVGLINRAISLDKRTMPCYIGFVVNTCYVNHPLRLTDKEPE